MKIHTITTFHLNLYKLQYTNENSHNHDLSFKCIGMTVHFRKLQKLSRQAKIQKI